MQKNFLFVLCLVSLVIIFGQCKSGKIVEPAEEIENTNKELSNVRIEGRKLTWNDFKGVADNHLSYEAYTLWNVYYKYKILEYRKDTAIIEVDVWRTFNQHSWRKTEIKSDSIELLNHEQGHYDIAKLCVNSLQHAFRQNHYLKSNYEYKIDSIYWHVLNQHIQLEKRYDFETKHFFNKQKQKEWNLFFEKQVN